MLSPEDSKPATETKSEGNRGGWGKSRKVWSPWGHLSDEKREQYERIEERVREKVRKGEL